MLIIESFGILNQIFVAQQKLSVRIIAFVYEARGPFYLEYYCSNLSLMS